MKIGVLSDTHLEKPNDKLKRAVQAMGDVDMIFHLGDIVSLDVIKFLEEKAPVKAVHGNMDPPEVVKHLPKKLILEIEGIRFGLTHGSGAPWGIEDRIKSLFHGDDVDVIVFGHTHNPVKTKKGRILFLNPGSPTDSFYAKENTVGIITVNNGSLDFEILRLS